LAVGSVDLPMPRTPTVPPSSSDSPDETEAGPPRLRVRYRAAEIRIQGELLIGRAMSCQIVLADLGASREHARIRIDGNSVLLEDLGSTNGTFLNGARVAGSLPLASGDRIRIGAHELEIVSARKPRADLISTPGSYRVTGAELDPVRLTVQRPRTSLPPDRFSSGSGTTSKLELALAMAESALDAHSASDAEALVSGELTKLRDRADDDTTAPAELYARAAAIAARLANETRKGAWIDYTVGLYRALRLPLPATVSEELWLALESGVDFDQRLLESYVISIQARARSLGASERADLQRLAQLHRLAMGKPR
jgi:pSer/pThr/pTyr-binding forkhead associated (FHA) protein